MKVCRWFGFSLVLVGLVCFLSPKLSVFAGGKDKEAPWEWKAFDEKNKEGFYQTLVTETTQVMTVMNMEVKQKQNQTFYIKWTPQKKDDKGNWVVSQKIVGVKMDIDIGGNKISYDSTQAEQPQNPMTDFFKALQKLDLTFTIDPKKMDVIKIEGSKKFIDDLAKTNPQMEPLLKSILSEDALKKMAEPTLYAFPPKAVKYDAKDKKGTTWDHPSKLELGPIGTYKTKYDFEYLGKEKDLEKIGIKATMTYDPPIDKGSLPFKIDSGELKSKEPGTGTAYFNPKAGRFDKYEMNMRLEGDLTIDIGGMKTKVDLKQDQKATVTSSDENPVAEKKKK